MVRRVGIEFFIMLISQIFIVCRYVGLYLASVSRVFDGDVFYDNLYLIGMDINGIVFQRRFRPAGVEFSVIYVA